MEPLPTVILEEKPFDLVALEIRMDPARGKQLVELRILE
jgi:hypothetical protein